MRSDGNEYRTCLSMHVSNHVKNGKDNNSNSIVMWNTISDAFVVENGIFYYFSKCMNEKGTQTTFYHVCGQSTMRGSTFMNNVNIKIFIIMIFCSSL